MYCEYTHCTYHHGMHSVVINIGGGELDRAGFLRSVVVISVGLVSLYFTWFGLLPLRSVSGFLSDLMKLWSA